MDLFQMMEEKGINIPKKEVQENNSGKKNNEAAKKAPKSNPNEKKEVKKPEPVKVTLPVNAFYSGAKFEITEEKFPDKTEVTLDEIKDYFVALELFDELTPKRTGIYYDEEDNAVLFYLILPGKGACQIEKLNLNSGIHFMKKGGFGYFIGPAVRETDISKKTDKFAEGVFLKKKIPMKVIEEIIATFYVNFPNECLAQVFYDESQNEYVLNFPERQTSISHIQGTNEYFFLDGDLSKPLILEIHSHGQFNCGFSTTDDANERDLLLYGLLTNMTETNPKLLFRIGHNGYFSSVDFDKIFDFEEAYND